MIPESLLRGINIISGFSQSVAHLEYRAIVRHLHIGSIMLRTAHSCIVKSCYLVGIRVVRASALSTGFTALFPRACRI